MNGDPSSSEEGPLFKAVSQDLTNLLASVDRDLAHRAQIKGYLRKLAQAWSTQDFAECGRLLRRQFPELRGMYPASSLLLEKLNIALERSLDEQYRGLQDSLRDYCSEERISLSGHSGHFVIDYLLAVVLNHQTRSAKVGNIAIPGFRWEKIQPVLEAERRRIWGRHIDPAKYRDRLLEVYQRLSSDNPSPAGWVRLADIYTQLKARKQLEEKVKQGERSRLVSYYKDEFSADLSRLTEAQSNGEIAGQLVEFSAIRDPRLAFHVVLPGGTIASYGFLRPRHD